jgi:hypothetical protein
MKIANAMPHASPCTRTEVMKLPGRVPAGRWVVNSVLICEEVNEITLPFPGTGIRQQQDKNDIVWSATTTFAFCYRSASTPSNSGTNLHAPKFLEAGSGSFPSVSGRLHSGIQVFTLARKHAS